MDDTIERLSAALLDTIDEFSNYNRLETGQAMEALFSVLVASAQASPQYDPKRLVEEVDAAVRKAAGSSMRDRQCG